MRRLIFQILVSLDGFFETANGEIDWHIVDDEFNTYSKELLDSVDTLLFGRVTYELMAGYWPTALAKDDDAEVAYKMNHLSKLVFSRSVFLPAWNNARVITQNIREEISTLKQQTGKDMVMIGSADLASTFIQLNLIDEYSIIVAPVVLGNGKRLFQDIGDKQHLELIGNRRFNSGNILLRYRPHQV